MQWLGEVWVRVVVGRAWSGEESEEEGPKSAGRLPDALTVCCCCVACDCAAACRYARAVPHLLALPLVRRVMLGLPAAVEAWRERMHLRADVFRNLRCVRWRGRAVAGASSHPWIGRGSVSSCSSSRQPDACSPSCSALP